MINQLNSSGAVAQAAPTASTRAYANGLQKYNPGAISSNPYLSVLGSALGTFAGGLATNPKLAQKHGDRLGGWLGVGTQMPLNAANSAESYIDSGGLGGGSVDPWGSAVNAGLDRGMSADSALSNPVLWSSVG